MIVYRKNPFSPIEKEVTFKEGETYLELVKRVLTDNGYEPSENMVKNFQILVCGEQLPTENWNDQVDQSVERIMITPNIKSGDTGTLKAVLITAVVVTASILFPPSAGAMSAVYAGLFTVAGTLAIHALIPDAGLPNMGGEINSEQDSQMYSITSQSNTAKKYGFVPKVYGTHKVYPTIASNPYTEIEADSKGNLVQYFYGIYDFGMGPMLINNVLIGDTPITEYADCEYRLVDPNKPDVSEGPWDDIVHKDFAFYKGDIEKDGTIYVLEGNQTDTGALEESYRVIRNASGRGNGDEQEIVLDFAMPSGLYGMKSDGKKITRNIELKVEYAVVGTNDWKGVTNPAFSNNVKVVGGFQNLTNRPAQVGNTALPQTVLESGQIPIYATNTSTGEQILGTSSGYKSFTNITTHTFGYKVGSTEIILPTKGIIKAGVVLKNSYDNSTIGTVKSVETVTISGVTCYKIKFTSGIKYSIGVGTRFVCKGNGRTMGRVNTSLSEWSRRYVDVERGYASTTFPVTFYNVTSGFLHTIMPVTTGYFNIEYINTTGTVTISGNTDKPYYSTIRFTPKTRDQIKVRITRVRTTSSGSTMAQQDTLQLVSLSTRFDRNPINTTKRHTFLEIRVKATNQLSGNIQNLSAVATSVLDVFNEETNQWEKQPTNNPAWIFTDLLTGQVNKKAMSKDRLELNSILEWSKFCDEVPEGIDDQYTLPRFQCNFILDYDTTLQSLITNVTNSAQASLSVIDGKYGILIDRKKTIPTQIFTPRNSWNFTSSRSYSDMTHAFKVRYVNPYNAWAVSELIVYFDGYNEDNATEFEEITSFGITNDEQAWRFGRFMMAQALLRRETISIEVDFEHLACSRGDFVKVTHDVMKVGGKPARVKKVTGDVVTLDEDFEFAVGVNYAYLHRSKDGEISTNQIEIISSREFKFIGVAPEVDDLVVIGESERIAMDCIVKSIRPNDSLTATLELVEKADAIYDSEYGAELPEYQSGTSTIPDSLLTPPPVIDLVVVGDGWEFSGTKYNHYVDLDWDIQAGTVFTAFEVYADGGAGYKLFSTTTESFIRYQVNELELDQLHRFKVIAVNAMGRKITLLEAPEVTHTPYKKTTPPSDVESLYTNITNQMLQLDWEPIPDADVKEYQIRFYPEISDRAVWENSVLLMKVDKNTTMVSIQGRVGTYFIKAVDYNNNQSENAKMAVTSIPSLFDLNIIQEFDDFPELNGVFENITFDGDGMAVLQSVAGNDGEYYPEGYYYMSQFLDLGDIYTVRLQSLITAEGTTPNALMKTWTTLAEIDPLASANSSDWDVEMQYRSTDTLNVMADWPTLADIDPISEGVQDVWTPWRKFTIGDYTARVFQFRLKFVSHKPNTSPRVFSAIIRADMPDRVDAYNDIVSGVDGVAEVIYDIPFKGPDNTPNIQITIEDAQTGDWYEFEYKNLNGFKIIFYDKDSNPVSRRFDASVKGYGRKNQTVI